METPKTAAGSIPDWLSGAWEFSFRDLMASSGSAGERDPGGAARNTGGVGVYPRLEVRVGNDHHHRHITYCVQRLNRRKAPAGGIAI
jgi:hypothetical protein